MPEQIGYEIINGIKCYNPSSCYSTEDYPAHAIQLTADIEKKTWWCLSRTRLFTYLLDKVSKKITDPCHYLEIACGTGALIESLAQNIPHLKITGSEIYLSALEHAQKKLPHAEFIQLDLCHPQPHLKDSFNAIGAFDVLEHLQEDTQAIDNIFQMLKKDGYFLVSVPQYQFMWSHLDRLVGHKRRYSKKELRQKLEKSGFKVCYTTSFVFTLFPSMLILRLLEQLPFFNKTTKEISDYHQKTNVTNRILNKMTMIDEWLIKKGCSLPFGGTLIILAQKV